LVCHPLRMMIGRSLLSVAPRVVTVIRRPSVSTLSTRQLLVIGGSGALVAAASAATAATSACDGTREIGEAPRLRILCLHGINLNMFGKRDPGTYGTATLGDIDDSLAARASALGVEVECFQTNFEGEMVERIHKAHVDGNCQAVLINAGAWTHYSYGLRDALAILNIPVVEVHMSNIHAREDMKGSMGEQMRHHSVVSPLAKGIVAGFGLQSYLLGLEAAVTLLRNE